MINVSSFGQNAVYVLNNREVNQWIKNINGREEEEYALHRACSSYNPLEDIIYAIVKRQGLSSFYRPNSIGITPIQYLKENPYAEVNQRKIINRYVLAMMGEIAL